MAGCFANFKVAVMKGPSLESREGKSLITISKASRIFWDQKYQKLEKIETFSITVILTNSEMPEKKGS